MSTGSVKDTCCDTGKNNEHHCDTLTANSNTLEQTNASENTIKMQIDVSSNNTQCDKSIIAKEATDSSILPNVVSEKSVTTAISSSPLSKNQLKKKRRWEKAMEVKKRRKLQDKQVKMERAKALGRDIDAERIKQEAARVNGENRMKRIKEWETNIVPKIQQSFQVCIDCAYESEMTLKEINSLAIQLRYCYSTNKKCQHPCQLTATSLGGNNNNNITLDHLKKVDGFEEWSNRAFVVTSEPLEKHFESNKDNIVYLTSDSETILTTLENHKIYVIGGIVDRNRLKRKAIDRATSLGISTARLPIDEHLSQMASTRVLTTNHVFELLLKYKEYNGCWKNALSDVLPNRKEAKFCDTE